MNSSSALDFLAPSAIDFILLLIVTIVVVKYTERSISKSWGRHILIFCLFFSTITYLSLLLNYLELLQGTIRATIAFQMLILLNTYRTETSSDKTEKAKHPRIEKLKSTPRKLHFTIGIVGLTIGIISLLIATISPYTGVITNLFEGLSSILLGLSMLFFFLGVVYPDATYEVLTRTPTKKEQI